MNLKSIFTYKNKRAAYNSYNCKKQLLDFKSRFILTVTIGFVGLTIACIPGLERTDRFLAVFFFIGLPITGVLSYYIEKYFFSDDNYLIPKLHEIFYKYVKSLSLLEQQAIASFLSSKSIFDEFEAEPEVIKSLLEKQIIYQKDYFGRTIYRIEDWAYDYFYTYKLSF